MTRVERGDGWELRLGDYREVLADVKASAVITDPPFGEAVHGRQRVGEQVAAHTKKGNPTLRVRPLRYDAWGKPEVGALVDWATGATTGWICALTSHDMAPVYRCALEASGRCVFAPVACVQLNRSVRLSGDGPANWSDWLIPSRLRSLERRSGALPGAYVGRPFDAGENMLDRSKRITGGKPRWLMQSIVRDYSRRGHLIVDPCAGGGTTLIAAVTEGRRAIGAEVNPDTFEMAVRRLRGGYTPTLPGLE